MGVTTIADISTGDGQRLSEKAYKRTSIGIRDTYSWPVQGNPPATDWKVWEYYIKNELGKYQTYPRPLGKWIVQSTEFLGG